MGFSRVFYNFVIMEKYNKRMGDFRITENAAIAENYSLLKLIPVEGLLSDSAIRPGQFVQVVTPNNATYLRRPISICYIDNDANEMWLLIRKAGDGTRALCDQPNGATINMIYSLGNGFDLSEAGSSPLLIGGGVGVAPLLNLGAELNRQGIKPTFLLGARSAKDVLLAEEFAKYGDVHVSTEDGSAGEKGLVTTNTILNSEFTHIYCCGPMPMMKAIAKIAREKSTPCEVSLENVMACGVGACLCCVEKTTAGNVCVCKEGPVFNIDQLLW